MAEIKRLEFRREVSIGDLIAITTAISAVLISYFNLKEQIAIHTLQLAAITIDQTKQDVTTETVKRDILDSLKEIKTDLRELRTGQIMLGQRANKKE